MKRSEEVNAMTVLVCNAGSTSLKFKLFDMPAETVLCESRIERVGSTTEAVYHYRNPGKNIAYKKPGLSIPGYTAGIERFFTSLLDKDEGVVLAAGSPLQLEDIAAVGFKTVLAKGFYGVHRLTGEVMKAMEEYLFVAPVHNRVYIDVVELFARLLPRSERVGVFETAFHTTIPLERRLYAIPYEWYERYGVQRLGYHSASHSYIAQTMAELHGGQVPRRIISCHLGGSCSISAILDGKSADNSFGFSLQAGIPHNNRVGDLDPYVMLYLLHRGMSMEELHAGLEKSGGMKGLSGLSNDMRDLEEAVYGTGRKTDTENKNAAADGRAKLALDVFVTAVQRYIGQYYVELGGLDALVFTAGIGENSPILRGQVCESAAALGIVLDREANESGKGDRLISAGDSKAEVWVITANEELGVARETYKLLAGPLPDV
jgi:acetate kinase